MYFHISVGKVISFFVQPVDFDTSYYHENEHVQLREYKSPEEGKLHSALYLECGRVHIL